MNEDRLLLSLSKAGIDVNGALGRFMENRELYLGFLVRLPEFLSCDDIFDALNREDEDLFYMKLHGLNGAAGNLGITSVYEVTSAIMVEFYASGFKNKAKLISLLEDIRRESAHISSAVRACMEQFAEGGRE